MNVSALYPNQFNPMMQQPPGQIQQGAPFQGVYGLLGGIQGLLNLLQCLLDVAYLMKLVKSV